MTSPFLERLGEVAVHAGVGVDGVLRTVGELPQPGGELLAVDPPVVVEVVHLVREALVPDRISVSAEMLLGVREPVVQQTEFLRRVAYPTDVRHEPFTHEDRILTAEKCSSRE
jgi:hypothetical protein